VGERLEVLSERNRRTVAVNLNKTPTTQRGTPIL